VIECLTMTTDREQFIESNGVRIWSCVRGEGVPVILCAGGAGCCDYLEPVAEMIDDLATVVRWEDRGCGRSECPPPYGVAASVAAMEDIRRHYGFERWIVGGHSWGPDLALAYALEFPQRTIALIGIAGGVVHRDPAWSEQYQRLSKSTPEYLPPFKYPSNMVVNKEMSGSWGA
jgi:proline iminopeptidase